MTAVCLGGEEMGEGGGSEDIITSGFSRMAVSLFAMSTSTKELDGILPVLGWLVLCLYLLAC